jgi:hypothetical protein
VTLSLREEGWPEFVSCKLPFSTGKLIEYGNDVWVVESNECCWATMKLFQVVHLHNISVPFIHHAPLSYC